jgi:hypothetical protein
VHPVPGEWKWHPRDREPPGWYVRGETEHGDMLARKLYFSPLYHISDTAYVLDLRKPGISKIVRNFQEYLKQKALRATLHEEKADSETERKPAKLVDISRQNGTDQNRRAALEALQTDC